MFTLFSLPLEFDNGAPQLTIYPTVLQSDDEVILVDCGYPGYTDKIDVALAQHHLSLADITKIIITHHDYDHMGTLHEITEKYPSIEVMCSGEQAPYVTGKSKSLRLIQAEELQDSLPENKKQEGLDFQAAIASVQPAKQVTAISPGQLIHCGTNIEVVDTTGHMPGHISLYVASEKTLIAGDALVVENGKLCMAVPQYTLNMEDARNSIKKLLAYDIEKIMCYHGGVFDSNVQENLRNIVIL